MASSTIADLASRTMADKPKKFISKAIKHPGALRKKAEAAGESTHEFAEEHKHDSGTTGAQSRLGLTLMGMHKGKPTKMYPKSRDKMKD
jgi:hypothetical protein